MMHTLPTEGIVDIAELPSGTDVSVGLNDPDPLPTDEPSLLAMANRRLRECDAVDQERSANAAAEKIDVQSLRSRYAEIDGPLEQRRARLVAELEAIYSALPHRGDKKSRRLAYGVLGTRTVPEKLEVTDEAALREEAQGWDPDLAFHVFRPQPAKLDHRSLVALVKSRGAVPAGCTLVPSEERFYVQVDAAPDLTSVVEARD